MPHRAYRGKGWGERLGSAEDAVLRWPRDLAQARAVQERMRSRVACHDGFSGPELVAGVDVGYDREQNTAVAAIAVLSAEDLRLVDWAVAREPVRFPYVPGFLSFREIPATVRALGRIHTPPDMFLCDGQGIAHPRGLGLASHLGVLLDMPCVGVAKSRLIGTHGPVGEEKGSWTPLHYEGRTVGIVLRSRARVKPIYVSCGHLVGLDSARDIVLRLTLKYKLPETTRKAHWLAGEATRAKGPEKEQWFQGPESGDSSV